MVFGTGVTDGYIRDPEHQLEARHRLSRIEELASVPELGLPVNCRLLYASASK
jgi:hypothetical protein